MEHLDQLIPFAVLVVVAAILVVLLRRTTREAVASPRAIETPVRAETAAQPITSAPLKVAEEIVAAPPNAAATKLDSKPRKQKPIASPVVITPSPIEAVLDLLKRKDSLATAFILREILDRPVSKRQ